MFSHQVIFDLLLGAPVFITDQAQPVKGKINSPHKLVPPHNVNGLFTQPAIFCFVLLVSSYSEYFK